MIPDYEKIMSFLGNTTRAQIVRLAATPAELEAILCRNTSEPEQLTPDTPEAWAAGMADGQMYDRAEEMITLLREENPETWTAFKEIVNRLAPEEATHLEKYDLPNLYDWKCPEYISERLATAPQ